MYYVPVVILRNAALVTLQWQFRALQLETYFNLNQIAIDQHALHVPRALHYVSVTC